MPEEQLYSALLKYYNKDNKTADDVRAFSALLKSSLPQTSFNWVRMHYSPVECCGDNSITLYLMENEHDDDNGEYVACYAIKPEDTALRCID